LDDIFKGTEYENYDYVLCNKKIEKIQNYRVTPIKNHVISITVCDDRQICRSANVQLKFCPLQRHLHQNFFFAKVFGKQVFTKKEKKFNAYKKDLSLLYQNDNFSKVKEKIH
jgi:hypothetical protein